MRWGLDFEFLYRRILALIFWLATTYVHMADHYNHKWSAGAKTAFGSIYSSFITMTTFGDFDLMHPRP